MKTTSRLITIVILASFGVTAGCRHRGGEGGKGVSSFVMLEQPSTPKESSEASNERIRAANYRAAEPMQSLVKPIYPPKALASKAGSAQIAVHIRIDSSGTVAEVRPSLLAVTITPPGFSKDFYDAVEAAVRQWKFHPAKMHHMETVSVDGFTYQRVTRTDVLETEFDMLFEFSPSGKVESGITRK